MVTTYGHPRSAAPRVCRSAGVQGGGGSAEFANPEGVDVLLEGNSFATVHSPHVDHLHNGWLSRALVLPPVVPERHDCVTVGDESDAGRRRTGSRRRTVTGSVRSASTRLSTPCSAKSSVTSYPKSPSAFLWPSSMSGVPSNRSSQAPYGGRGQCPPT